MSYSPDFSSVSPATQWAPPTAAPPAEYVLEPSTSLMQAPPKDSYTPSFAQSSTDTQPTESIPFIGNHPAQTVGLTVLGAVGTGVISGAVTNAIDQNNQPAPPAKDQPATVTKTGWAIVHDAGVHTDGTPKRIKDDSTGILYNITDINGVKGVTPVLPPENPKNTEWVVGENNTTLTRKIEGVTQTVKKENNGQITLTVDKPTWRPKTKRETQVFLIDKTNHSAVQLDTAGNIIKLITNLDQPDNKQPSSVMHRLGVDKQEIRKALTAMNLEKVKIEAFLIQGMMPYGAYCRRPVELGKETCEALTSSHGLNFDHKIAELKTNLTKHPTTWDALKTACEFKPFQKAGEKITKDFNWGKVTPFAIGGALVGAAAIFGLDFFLQRRKISAETVETQ